MHRKLQENNQLKKKNMRDYPTHDFTNNRDQKTTSLEICQDELDIWMFLMNDCN